MCCRMPPPCGGALILEGFLREAFLFYDQKSMHNGGYPNKKRACRKVATPAAAIVWPPVISLPTTTAIKCATTEIYTRTSS